MWGEEITRCWRQVSETPHGVILGDGGGFRSAGESGIEEGGVPTRAEAGTGLEVAAVGLVEEGGAARRDGAEA